ncbi:hypothetical protein [Vannielia litorea]|uniref:Predicted 5' DNA nuclease, flap endonuclease-1-like, helix-3-turn-helix (H3TH) domain n=1 Tax=Vannielia litorea TaxID=1217970 RepID=A0A1N6DVK4_9RHOB|nr:hypothetical protein [Vannielia litorea]SIN74737.1 Predicted 5' DNA nuclease, flap endonuclease-1-like, helix-3-turn-helix (H3TH) domain [Vannielia litorea]
MFQNWGFLLTEIWFLLILAALVGLLAGWIFWGKSEVADEAVGEEGVDRVAFDQARANEHRLRGERDELLLRLDRCRSDGEKKDARMKEMEGELDELRGKAAFTAPLAAFEAEDDEIRAFDETSGTPAAPVSGTTPDFDGDGTREGAGEGTAPATLDGPRDGGPDDLKKIKGVGKKLEALLHSMGFYHFDQIASWTADEEAWVNANLVGFKGRVSRDNWVEQAKLLASGSETAFSQKVDKGGVYD